jgi:hypothetical protein
MQRVIGLLVLALVLFWIVDSPGSAANTVQAIFALLASAANSVVTFLQALF